jgi:DNA-binding NarL/FixJ family response regulator
MNDRSLSRLTERQREVLYLVCRGLRNSEIAAKVGVSPRTVKGYVAQLLLIFDATNRTELAGMLALEYSVFRGKTGHLDRPEGPCGTLSETPYY